MSSAVLGLIILAVCVVLFLTKTFPMSVTGCLGCFLMALLKVAPMSKAISGFGSSIVILMASAMIVGIAMKITGVAKTIGEIAVKLANGEERTFLITSCILGAALSMFFANTAIIAMFIPIIDSICDSSKNMKRRNLLLPITCAVMIGGAGTLIGCTPQLTADAMMTKLNGQGFEMWTLTLPAFGVFVMFMAYLMLVGHWLGGKIWGNRPEISMENSESPGKIPEIKNIKVKKKLMILFLIMMIFLYITELIPVTETACLTALLCIITGCCSTEDIRKNFRMGTVVFLASCLGLAECLTEAGSGELIGKAVEKVLGNTNSPVLIFAAVVALTLILSQFITNSTAIIIVMPIGMSLCSVYNFSPLAFSVGITLAASVACCTPLAASQITMTQVAGYEFSDYLKYCGLPTLVMYAGILIFVPLCYPLTL